MPPLGGLGVVNERDVRCAVTDLNEMDGVNAVRPLEL
jgi:hypothetical protein